MRRIVRDICAALASLLLLTSMARAGNDRPDILLIIADDMDYQHLGFRNPAASTPTLDRLARKGTTFQRTWMTPRCAPSMSSILSGRYPHEHGRYFNIDGTAPARDMDLTEAFPHLLRGEGYRNYLGGKYWHGFDLNLAGFDRGDTNLDFFVRQSQADLFNWLDHVAENRNFLIWWAPYLPHAPHDAGQEFRDRIDRNQIQIPNHVAQEDAAAFLDLEHNLLANTARFDQGLADLALHLKGLNRLNNLIVLFCIDNGWANGVVSKGSPYEKAIQSPLILAGRGIPMGQIREELVSVVDIYPTLLDYANIAHSPRSGMSLRGLIEGGGSPPRETHVSVTYPAIATFRSWQEDAYAIAVTDSSRFKYVAWLRDISEADNNINRIVSLLAPYPERTFRTEELYDLKNDPLELTNLAQNPQHESTQARLRQKAREWWRQASFRQ